MRTGAGIALPFRSGAGCTCPDRSRRSGRRLKHSWKRPLLLWQTACRRSPRQFRARAAARRTRGLGSPGPLREIPLLQQRFTPSAIQFPQYFLPGRRDRHGLRPGAPLSECVLHAAILRREPFHSRIPPESPDLIQHHFLLQKSVFCHFHLTIYKQSWRCTCLLREAGHPRPRTGGASK